MSKCMTYEPYDVLVYEPIPKGWRVFKRCAENVTWPEIDCPAHKPHRLTAVLAMVPSKPAHPVLFASSRSTGRTHDGRQG